MDPSLCPGDLLSSSGSFIQLLVKVASCPSSFLSFISMTLNICILAEKYAIRCVTQAK